MTGTINNLWWYTYGFRWLFW